MKTKSILTLTSALFCGAIFLPSYGASPENPVRVLFIGVCSAQRDALEISQRFGFIPTIVATGDPATDHFDQIGNPVL